MRHVRKSSFVGDLKASNQGIETSPPDILTIKLFEYLAAEVENLTLTSLAVNSLPFDDNSSTHCRSPC